MGIPVTYCAQCGLRLSGQEVASGEAVARNGALYCRKCAPYMPRSENPTLDATPPPRSAPFLSPPPPSRPVMPPAPLSAPGADDDSKVDTVDESAALGAEGRRKRAERRMRTAPELAVEDEDLLADEPFPWLLVLAGAGAALVIVLGLWIIFHAPSADATPPPVDAPAPPPPTEKSAARKTADELLEKARHFEATGDFENAYLALELAAQSPIHGDSAIDTEVARERDRLLRKRQLARAREANRKDDPYLALDALHGIVDGPELDEARRLRTEAQRRIDAQRARTQPGPEEPAPRTPTREQWLAAAMRALGAKDEEDFLARRRSSDLGSDALCREFEKGEARHACWSDKAGEFKGFNMAGGQIDKCRQTPELSPREHRFYVLVEPGASKITFKAPAETKPFTRMIVRVFGKVTAPPDLEGLANGVVSMLVNGEPAGELLYTDGDVNHARGVEVTKVWRADQANEVVLVLKGGPSPVWVETIEVIALVE